MPTSSGVPRLSVVVCATIGGAPRPRCAVIGATEDIVTRANTTGCNHRPEIRVLIAVSSWSGFRNIGIGDALDDGERETGCRTIRQSGAIDAIRIERPGLALERHVVRRAAESQVVVETMPALEE